MKRVYVCGKLNADACNYIKNCHQMIKYADKIRRMGFSVYIPCLDFLSGLVMGDYEYQDYFKNNLPWLECADYIFVIPDSENSKGTQAEIKRAQELGIPVFDNLTFFEVLKMQGEPSKNEKLGRT
jgi:hypothetical protein